MWKVLEKVKLIGENVLIGKEMKSRIIGLMIERVLKSEIGFLVDLRILNQRVFGRLRREDLNSGNTFWGAWKSNGFSGMNFLGN
jgi:hypothetical protein